MNYVCNVMYNVKEWGVFQAKRQKTIYIYNKMIIIPLDS